MKTKNWKLLVKIFLPLVILGIGILITVIMIKSKKPPFQKEQTEDKAKLVKAENIPVREHKIVLVTHGTISASSELNISPEVSGKVQWMNPSLTEGGWIKENDILFKIDPISYELKAEQAKAALTKAEYDYDLVKSQEIAATEERKKLGKLLPKGNQDFSKLALYEPQLKNAKANLESALANLKEANLNLERTTIRAPFNGYIRTVSLALGQYISVNQSVAKMFSDRPMLLKVSLPVSDLAWLEIEENGDGKEKKGSLVDISKQVGNVQHHWKGVVKRQAREINSLGRLVNIIIEIENPVSHEGFVLPVGLFVEAQVHGKTLPGVMAIPHTAFRSEQKVWFVTAENKLGMKKIEVVYKDDQYVFVDDPLLKDRKVILSPIATPIEGMPLMIQGETPPPEKRQRGNGGPPGRGKTEGKGREQREAQ